MNSFAFILVVVAVIIQNGSSQCIRGGLPMGISPVRSVQVAQPSVAASLADTLSLLTVSSLLAESLPLNPNVVATVPVPMGPAYAPALAYGGCRGGCGGGCGCGCGGLDYGYSFYI